MSTWQWLVLYVKALKPSALAAYLRKAEAAAFQRGFENGFDKGHRRGWIDLRARVGKHGERFPHVPTSNRN